ncbi:MAG: hypothetical protein JWR85_2751 [Marmoricola sp.]|nr:hypothetical protein [Marmoricola sp.]
MRRPESWRVRRPESWRVSRHPSWPVLVGAVALVTALAAVATAVVVKSDPQTAPPWRGSLDGCRTNAMAHVHDPSRLELMQTCSTFTGVVKAVRLVPAYNDVKITLTPTGDMDSFLPAANKGVLVADVIATDYARVGLPAEGSRVSVWGAWVHDKATKTAMLLPAYRIAVEHAGSEVIRGQSTDKHAPPVPRQLRLQASAQPLVTVGGEVLVNIRARWSQFGALSPASQVRLFLEMTTPDGVGVRWKAAETDTRGVATVHMVAIQVPATYSLTVYAISANPPISVRTPVRVTHR